MPRLPKFQVEPFVPARIEKLEAQLTFKFGDTSHVSYGMLATNSFSQTISLLTPTPTPFASENGQYFQQILVLC